MNDTTTAAAEVATLLRQLEQDLDRAFATSGRLATALPIARAEAKLSAVVGQQAFEHVSSALQSIGAARGHAVAGHRVLEVIAKRMGYETAFGDEQPKDPFTSADGSHLRVAA